MATKRKKKGKAKGDGNGRNGKKARAKRAAKNKPRGPAKEKKVAKSKRSVKPKAAATGAVSVGTAAGLSLGVTDNKPKELELEFTKLDNSPDDVKISLKKPQEVVLRPGESKGKSDPRPPGAVDAVVQVSVPTAVGGNRTATVEVTNVTASPILVTVPDGSASRTVIVTLMVKG